MVTLSRARALVGALVVSAPLVGSGCDELALRRTSAGAAVDSVSEHPDPPKPRARPRPREAANPSLDEKSFAQVRQMLRRLVAAEETFLAENGTYSDDLSLIGFSPDRDTEARFLWISRDGWAASGTHAAIEGRDCVIFVGKAHAPPTTLKYVRQGREGIPVCDDASRPPEPRATRPPPPAPPAARDTGNALDALSPTVAMKVDLRNLVRSQETYFATQGVYARRTEPLALQYLWHRDVRVTILSADAQSWSARATHPRFPGKSCVIWYGLVSQRPATESQRRRGDRAGEPVCDN